MIRRRPGVAALVVATLAIGIAATTIVYSLADAILWHPLPFARADRFVRVRATAPKTVSASEPFTIERWSAKDQILDGVYPFALDSAIVKVGSQAEAVTVGELSRGTLAALGVTPVGGRDFTEEEYRTPQPVVIVSADLWSRLLAAGMPADQPRILAEGVPQVIVGHMPPGFEFPVSRNAMWRPYRPPQPVRRVTALGVLKPGVRPTDAQAFADATTRRGDAGGPEIRLTPFVLANETTATALRVLIGAVGILLLIATGNASNVLLAEAVRRDGELAVRASLGASRWRLVRQISTEVLVVALAAMAIALLLASWALTALVGGVPYLMSFQSLRPIALDWRALVFATAISALTGLVASSVTVWRAGRVDVQSALRGVKAGHAGHARVRIILTVAQLAATLVMLAAAGLLGNGFLRLSRIDPGFDPARLVQIEFQLPTWRFADETHVRDALERLRADAVSLPGVAEATITRSIPPNLGYTTDPVYADGGAVAGGLVASTDVDQGFFRTLGIPILEGRGFDDRDRPSGLPVAIVSRALAEKLWPGHDAIGRQFRISSAAPWLTIVGVAADVRNGGFEQPVGQAAYYMPRTQTPAWWYEDLVVRAQSSPDRVVPALTALVRQDIPDAPVLGAHTAYETIAGANARVRFATVLIAGIAAIALVLALVGVYAAFWCAVAQRTKEIGVRLALGAAPSNVMRLVLAASARQTLVGVAVGLPLAFAAARLLRSLLFEVSPTDPITFAAVVAFLAMAALAATYVPARRASRVDPVEALRHE